MTRIQTEGSYGQAVEQGLPTEAYYGPRISEIAARSLAGESLTREEAAFILGLPDTETDALTSAVFPIRKKYKGMTVSIQLLTNARSGNCTQNCAYCAQSRDSKAAIDKYRLVDEEKLLGDARVANEKHLSRHCIGLSGLRFADDELEEFAAYVRDLKKESGLPICCSIGFLTEDQARLLKDAGVDRINHNLNTSRRHYPNICTTHTYDERVANIRMLQGLGFEICSGGIIGMGEEDADVLDMLFDLRGIAPQAVPINFLIPLDGTGLEGTDTSYITADYALRVLSLARLLMPQTDIRCAAGREIYLAGREREMLRVVDSIFASGYLTAGGQGIDDTIALVKAAGFTPVVD
ncbi:MAG: biotin synthase BioB [Clostridiales Family XIII bacterium]|nr:biotin synthase BioB [Clostridiales Family XIII bacterium]